MKNSKKVPATKASKGESPNNTKTPQRNQNAKSKDNSASKELKQSQNISPVSKDIDDNVNIQETDLNQTQKSKKSSAKSPNKESTKSPMKAETPSNQENNNPAEKVISTRAYLEQTVVSVVQEGMLELARTKPDNPLEFLGNFILERAKQNK